MDRVVYYEHYFGSIEDLKNKDSTRLKKLNEVDYGEAERASKSFGSSLIIIPRFIGTYQEWYIKADNEEEKKYKKEINQQKKRLELFLNKILKTRNNDSIHPNLIHICYDPKQYTSDIVRPSFGEGSSRLGISSYKNSPNFYNKNSALVSIYLEKMMDTNKSEKIQEKIETISEDGFNRFQSALKEFGLTLEEISFFEMLGKLRNISSNRETNPLLINTPLGLIEE